MKPLPSEITEIAEVLSHHLPSAPKVERPKRQKKSRQDSIEDEDGVEGVDYITRCFCELKHNDPSMVQCDQCKAWQHLNCFGGANVVNTEGEFFCHVCKPRKLPLTKDEAQDLQKLFLNGSQKPKKKQKSLDKSLSSQKVRIICLVLFILLVNSCTSYGPQVTKGGKANQEVRKHQ